MPKSVKTSCYLVIEPVWRRWKNSDGTQDVEGAKVTAVRSAKPKLGQNQYAIKIGLELPDSLFLRFIPQVNLTVKPEQIIEPGAAVLDPERSSDTVPRAEP